MKEKNERIYEAGFQDGVHAAAGMAQTGRNETAFIIGVIGGLIGIWGLAHVLNGKVLPGCLWMFFVGPLIGAALVGLSVATAGIGLLVALPLWLYIVYTQANSGAARV